MNRTSMILLVVLRIAIGWHFLYEGLVKIQSGDAAPVYRTSRYFLQASTARLRDSFAQPASAAELTAQAAEARIDQWQDQIVKHFKSQDNPLSEEQLARLDAVAAKLKQAAAATFLDPEYAVSIRTAAEPSEAGSRLASVINIDWYFVHEEVLKIASGQEDGEHFTSLAYLRSSAGPFRGFFRGLVPDLDGLARLAPQSAQARIDRRYAELLDHYRSRGYAFSSEQQAKLALLRDGLKHSIAATLADEPFQVRLADYRRMLDESRNYAARLDAAYSRERLEDYRKRLDTVGGELLAFVNEPLAELTLQAEALATADQMKAGPPPRSPEQTALLDWTVKWGLTAMGICLLIGLFSRAAAFAAALQLAMFYFASPPFPGLPATNLNGHYLYVDRNLIELIAALALATVPSGRWAGLDSWVIPAFSRFRSRLRRQPDLEAEEVLAAQV